MSRVQGMDPASSAINTAANAADACRQIWQLCEGWHDAPKEISQLRDELAQANEFFSMVQLAVTKQTWARTADWVGQLTYELEECFHKAASIVAEVQDNLTMLLNVSLVYGVDISNKRRRSLWLRSHDRINRLRNHLKDAMFEICSILALLEDSGSTGIESSTAELKKLAEAKEQDLVNHTSLTTDMDHLSPETGNIHGMEDVVLFNDSDRSTRTSSVRSSSLALERYDPERHKSRWAEHKRLGARETPFSISSPRGLPCEDGCICACHAVKNWGRWALPFPLLGTLMVSYRGVSRRRIPCSNPRCKSVQLSEKLVRVDVYPSTWLLRATISVFLSLGLPSPEMVLRVNKVTEVTDVHSNMNQLLWMLQREDPNGVKHFLQGRLVRADDVYGDPVNGFTPLRLAFDRRSGEIARLLYQSGGFHGTLPAIAASSLLLWLEQDPAAADFLTQNFPLSTVIEEADYNTLHQIIMGLRHLNLYEYLRTPEALALVNQPNAFGRTPLHVAALRGNAEAVLALLDAGAARDARGNHAKHALHYACKAGSIAVVDALVARGASLQVRDNLYRTPLFDLVGYGANANPNLVTHLLALGIVQDPADWVTATLLALSNKRTAVVERLLPYWPPAHELPLYPAIHIGFPDGVRLLLGRGADYRTIDAFGEGILHWLAGSGLEMLRLFKGIGIHGVDVERRDNRGKTAMEIMEGRWDLTEEFRREFLELLDSAGKDCEQRDDMAGEYGEVPEVDDKNETDLEDEDLSEDDEFFDALDTSNPAVVAPEEERLPAVANEPPRRAEQDRLYLNGSENMAHDKELLLGNPEMADDSDAGSVVGSEKPHTQHDEHESERWNLDEEDHAFHLGASDGQQKYLRSPRSVEQEADKVFTDEAGLKFRGTSAALRGH